MSHTLSVDVGRRLPQIWGLVEEDLVIDESAARGKTGSSGTCLLRGVGQLAPGNRARDSSVASGGLSARTH